MAGRPPLQPSLQHRRRGLGLGQVLELGGALAHGPGGGGAPRGGHERRVQAGAADQGLGRPVGRVQQAQPALHLGQGQHPVLVEGGGQLLAGHPVDLMAAVGDEVEDEPQLAQLGREPAHLLVGHPGGVPVERRRQVVGQHLVGVHGVDRFGEGPGVFEVGGLGLHPQDVAEGGHGQRLGHRVVDAALHLVIALGGQGQGRVPGRVEAQLGGPGPGGLRAGGAGEGQPLLGGGLEALALGGPPRHPVGHGLGVGGEPGRRLPRLHQHVGGPVHRLAGGDLRGPVSGRGLLQGGPDAGPVQPRFGPGVGLVGDGVQEVAVDLIEAGLAEELQHGQVGGLVGRDLGGGSQDEGLVAFVAAAVQQAGRLGVGAGHDDAGDAHHVELEAGRVEALDLLVHRDQHLAALVAALLLSRLLVLDVVAGHADLHEPPDQVADVGVAAVAGVGVGDDERGVVHLGGAVALGGGHAGPQEPLVAVGSEQAPHHRRGLVGHPAEGVAGQVGAGVLLLVTLGRGGPAAQVDALDPGPLHGHGLARRVGPERGDGPPGIEQLPQAGVEPLGRVAGHGVVGADGAPLFHHLAGRVQPAQPGEPGPRHPLLHRPDLGFESSHGFPPFRRPGAPPGPGRPAL